MTDEAFLTREAAQLMGMGRVAEAAARYRELLALAHTGDEPYEEWLMAYRLASFRAGNLVHAGYAALYLGDYPEASRLLGGSQVPRCAECASQVPSLDEAEMHRRLREAARGYIETARPVHAAICFSRGAEQEEARQCWERLLGDSRLREAPPYVQALVRFNLGRAVRQLGDSATGDRQFAEATRLLEEAADDFESKGARERAFDCYQILIEIGREAGAFENIAEGYINSIRVLREDDLKLYALQYYEDFLRVALEREEFYAAATLYREAAEFAQRANLSFSKHYLRRAGETWWAEADKNIRNGGPSEFIENALLAAVDCYNALGDFFRVRETYRRLADLDLLPKRRERYRRIAGRYGEVWREETDGPTFPEHLRQPNAYADIWFSDLIEWELDGNFAEVAATVIADKRYPAVIRRRALNLALFSLDSWGPSGVDANGPTSAGPGDEALAQVGAMLGSLQTYAALRPLEKIYESPRAPVRRGVMRALKHLLFKRTFNLLRQGLRDADPGVREEALGALGVLHFPHAFEPLMRIYREHEDAQVKKRALEGIGHIGSVEAGTFMIDVIRFEGPPLRDVAVRVLRDLDSPEVRSLVERHAEIASGAVRAALDTVLR